MKEKNKKEKTLVVRLEETIKDMKDEAKAYSAYKQLIITAIKSNNEPRNVIGSLKFVAKHIKNKNWNMVDRVAGVSGDLMARGTCPKCDINLIGEELRPRAFTLPCKIIDCPFRNEDGRKKSSNSS